MKSQRNRSITRQDNSSSNQFFMKGNNPRAGRGTRMLLSCLLLLAASLAAFAQQPQTSVCYTANPTGGRYCDSPQYRSGTDLTGSSMSDVLGANNVTTVTQKFVQSTNDGVAPLPLYGPSSSPSTITRTIFASQDDNGNWGLWAFGIGGGSYGWDTITQGTTISAPIRSSPGYATRNVEPYIYVGAEDGYLYAFGYTDGSFGWKYQAYDAIDSSPTVSDADEVYIFDASGFIHKVNGRSGQLMWKQPIASLVNPTGVVSASSVALANRPCPGTCTGIYVSGNTNYESSSGGGIVQAFDAVSAAPLWTNSTIPYAVTSSPVVSESNQLIYVQSQPSWLFQWYGDLIYALDQTTGAVNWKALPGDPTPSRPPAPDGSFYYRSTGSPAYDATANRVIAVAENVYVINDGQGNSSTTFEGSDLTAYDGRRLENGGGGVIWNVDTKHAISNSSPTISNGVVYVGTDDGYILAFAESNGTLLWTSPQMTLVSGKPDPILAPPVISVNRIHVTTQSGTLYVYGLDGF